MKFLQIYMLFFINRLREANLLLEEQGGEGDPEYYIMKSKIAIKQRDFSFAHKLLNQLQTEKMDLEDRFKFHVTRSTYYWAVKDLEKFQNCVLYISENYNEKYFSNSKIIDHFQAEFLLNKGLVHLINQNLDKALSFQRKSSILSTKIGDIASIGSSYNNIATIYVRLADYSNALVNLKKASFVFKQLDDRKSQALILNNIGELLLAKGNLASSLEYYDQSLEVAEKYNELYLEAKILNNMGNVYLLLGKLQLAKTLYSQSININNKIGNDEGLALSYHNLGKLYRNQGNYDLALKYFNKANILFTAVSQSKKIFDTLVEKIILYCKTGNLEKAKFFLSQLEQETIQQNQPLLQLQYKFAKAVIMAYSGLRYPQILATKLFDEIIQAENINFEINLRSLFYYIEINIKLQQASSIINPKTNIEGKINHIYKTAQQNSSIILVAEALLLKAKLAYLKNHKNEIEYYMAQSKMIAIENGFLNLLDKIEKFVEIVYNETSPVEPNFEIITDSITDMRKISYGS